MMAKVDESEQPSKATPSQPGGVPRSGAVPEAPSVPPLLDESATPTFPVVGIGSSAGGLEALEAFFGKVPPECGLAFVVIQHLDPERKGMMVELLQRRTPIPVTQATDGETIQPNHIYIIPPNADMSILHGNLHLMEPLERRGQRLPIDFFFRSLAADRGRQSMGVLLSGMGSDGSLGLRAIHEQAGATFVQDPRSAAFPSMPNSAISAGYADVVAPVDELPARIMTFLHRVTLQPTPLVVETVKSQSNLEKIIILLRNQVGHDFSHYKPTTLNRRVERRMGLHNIEDASSYVRFLQHNKAELALLFKEFLIGVTSFFRDEPAWEQLRDEIMPDLLNRAYSGRVLRAWVPGCSTGEEAYSLAMIFREAMDKVQTVKNVSLQIFATDLDADAIDKARSGKYPVNIATDVSAERLNRFFTRTDEGYQINNSIREMVVFAPQNLLMDPPFTKLDILSCRNVLIYLIQSSQVKVLSLFHYSLNPQGILALGTSETVGSLTDFFESIEGPGRYYRRLDAIRAMDNPQIPLSISAGVAPDSQPPRLREEMNIQQLCEQLLLSTYAPPSVLTNQRGEILFIHGRTGKFLEPPAGKANWNFFAMTRPGLSFTLNNGFQRAVSQGAPLILPNIALSTNGHSQIIDVTILPLTEPSPLAGMVLISFIEKNDLPGHSPGELKEVRPSGDDAPDDAQTLFVSMEREIEQLRYENRVAREEYQSAQEELRSANEELQSTNEELQSTNEELTTSKEEMQSMNEELQTVNFELMAKIEELSGINNDMRNLLDSTDIATIFLDNDLNIRRFTPSVTQIIRLVAGDVGRPITDITSDLVAPSLADEVRGVLRSLMRVEREIPTVDGRWFLMRILPYRTADNHIDGVVITLTDISTAKQLEAALRKSAAALKEREGTP